MKLGLHYRVCAGDGLSPKRGPVIFDSFYLRFNLLIQYPPSVTGNLPIWETVTSNNFTTTAIIKKRPRTKCQACERRQFGRGLFSRFDLYQKLFEPKVRWAGAQTGTYMGQNQPKTYDGLYMESSSLRRPIYSITDIPSRCGQDNIQYVYILEF